jgi:hypothetical protein
MLSWLYELLVSFVYMVLGFFGLNVASKEVVEEPKKNVSWVEQVTQPQQESPSSEAEVVQEKQD